MIKDFSNHLRVIILYMNSPKLLLFIIILFNACAPHIKVVERYPNDQKKTTEVFKHKRLGSALKKRLTYHASGQVETETNFSNKDKHGTFFSYYENGRYAIKGNYKFGKKSGKWEWLDLNGQLDSVYSYKNYELAL